MGFIINNYKIAFEDYNNLSNHSEVYPIVLDIMRFLNDWFNPSLKDIEVMTSGSTGLPKVIRHPKTAMIKSAEKTAHYFSLCKGDIAVLALPAKFIAGKMMIVRAIISKLDLIIVEPNALPIQGIEETIAFIPLTPYQFEQSFRSNKDTFKSVKKVLLGGGPITANCFKIADALDTEIYHGFGMTETITHIAVRRINKGKEMYYKALEGIHFKTGDKENLVIYADHLETSIKTNDIVNLIDQNQFEWLGRSDNVVNSGGIKLHPEKIESIIGQSISNRYFLIGENDVKLGEILVMVVEGEINHGILDKIRPMVDKYEMPKKIYFMRKFLETPTSKINRKESFAQITGNK